MRTVYLQSLGFALVVIGLIMNAIALFLMRKEKAVQTHRDLLTCINASRILFNFMVFLWWIVWVSYHGRGIEKAILLTFDLLHFFYDVIVIGFTIDRLVAVSAPVQYKAMPIEHIHRVFMSITAGVSLLMTVVFSLCYKNMEIRAYITLTIDACFLLITTSAYLFIQKRWNKRMNLAKKIGAMGRALQRLDSNMTKIGAFVALCAILSSLADIYLKLMEFQFPANTTTDLSAAIVLLISCVYVLQPLYCIVVGVGFSAKDLKQAIPGHKHFNKHTEGKQGLFRSVQFRPSWANL